MNKVCCLLLFILLGLNTVYGDCHPASDEITKLRIRYYNQLVGKELDATHENVKKWIAESEALAEDYFDKMEDISVLGHGFIDITLPEKGKEDLQGSKSINAVFSRLKLCALVLKMEQSRFYYKKNKKNRGLLKKVLKIIDYMNANYFNPETFGIYYEDLDGDGYILPFKWVDRNGDNVKQPDEMEVRRCNWWHMEIGIPRDFNDILVLLYDEISVEKRGAYLKSIDTFIPSPNWTTGGAVGANGIWAARNVILRAILAGNPFPEDVNTARYRYSVDKLAASKQKVEELITVFPLEAGTEKVYKEGFYADGSCISHSRNSYTGGYGIGLLSDNLVLINLLAGSRYAVSNQKIDIIYNWMVQSFIPLMAYGAMADFSRGRGVSRYDETGLAVGRSVLRCAVEILSLVDNERKIMLEQTIKRQLTFALAYLGETYFDDFPPLCTDKLKKIYNDSSVIIPKSYRLCKHFPVMNRFIFHGENFIAGVAAHSKRIFNYEGLNSENHRGWHTSDGMLYLYNEDFLNYNQNFWPTYDAHYPAGTTVEENSEMDQGNKVGRNDWCGGVTSDNHLYGCLGVQLQPAIPETLSANKSYFFYDDKIICMGSGITDINKEKQVFTVVENRRLPLMNTNLLVKSNKLDSINWTCLLGKTDKTNIGYVFYNAPLLEEEIEYREGTWRDIDRYALFIDTVKYGYNYYTMKINHGRNPYKASYAYAILPGYSVEQIKQMIIDSNIKLIDDTDTVHAVKGENIFMANFWSAGASSDRFIAVDGTASLICEEYENSYLLTVSDPTQMDDFLTVELAVPIKEVIKSNQRLLSFKKENGKCILKFNVQGLFGNQIKISLRK